MKEIQGKRGDNSYIGNKRSSTLIRACEELDGEYMEFCLSTSEE